MLIVTRVLTFSPTLTYEERSRARVAELVDAADSKSAGFTAVGVQVPALVPYENPTTPKVVSKAPNIRGFFFVC
ncbi:protein of unknown function [Pseudodesulfovibrio piezophilus C1TLV30]|uniref:Uncharacterized protein n=1 Tax=Pseudodesulfovibrio piezophilus (strain DSM 21447 / JCM 15486 / C1TLV30) TaxID=1322246 RepID=M1WRZ2_PSEP2|nr:protein of unknown function [Pseudodesulfovibrio piezophilus C1TLV30]